MNRVSYLVREAFVNLRRNALVVTGAILAVFISLSFAFGALVVNELVRVNTVAWQQGVHIIAFLKDESDAGIGSDAHAALFSELLTWEEVKTAVYFDKADAFREAQEILPPDILSEIDPSILPASLRVELHDIDLYQNVQFRLVGSPVVRKVVSLGDRIEALSSLSRVLNRLGLGLALVLGFGAVVLIANTIRMAIYARRDEVAIMKLVGASNGFIRVPFFIEGMLEGLLGAALAVIVVWAFSRNLADAGEALPLFNFTLRDSFFYRWGILFLIFGGAAGLIGSVVGLRRFLREADGARPVVGRRVLEEV